jgi:chemotaxis protein CheD
MSLVFAPATAQETGSLVVGMGEYIVSTNPGDVLVCIGLGSCVAVCMHDRLMKIGGMVHVVLPKSDGRSGSKPAKCADTAVPLLLGEMIKNGGFKSRLTVKIVGGAQMTVAPGLRDTFKTGERNITQIKAALQKENLSLAAADVGGNLGRTVRLYLDTGKVIVKTVNGEPREI